MEKSYAIVQNRIEKSSLELKNNIEELEKTKFFTNEDYVTHNNQNAGELLILILYRTLRRLRESVIIEVGFAWPAIA